MRESVAIGRASAGLAMALVLALGIRARGAEPGGAVASDVAPASSPGLIVTPLPDSEAKAKDPRVLPDPLRTRDGRVFERPLLRRLEREGIVIDHASGISLLRFAELPEEIAVRFRPPPPEPSRRASAPARVVPEGAGPVQGRRAPVPWYESMFGVTQEMLMILVLGIVSVAGVAGVAVVLRFAGRLCGAQEVSFARALGIVLLGVMALCALAVFQTGIISGGAPVAIVDFGDWWEALGASTLVALLLAVFVTMYLFETNFVTGIVTILVTLALAALAGGALCVVGAILLQVMR